MNEALIAQVEELGLSNKEARVYIANLMLGSAGVQQIADTSGIKRVTTYVILESLVNLGLVSQTVKAKKTLFNAESPQNLRRLLDKREQLLQDQKRQFNELLPQLSNLTSPVKEVPDVKLYDGVEGLRTLTRDYIRMHAKSNTDKIYELSNADQIHQLFPEVKQEMANPYRLQEGIKSHLMYTSSRGEIYKAHDEAVNRDTRYLGTSEGGFRGDIAIVGDVVMLMALSGSRPIGVTIESKDIVETMKVLFNMAWDAAEKPTVTKN